MVRIDKYGFGGTCGSASKTLAEKDISKFVSGEYDILAVQVARKNLEIQALTAKSLAENPIEGVTIDATILY